MQIPLASFANLFRNLCVAIFWISAAASASAHSFNESYVYFNVGETTLSGRIEVTLTDLAKVVANDGSVDTPLTEDEVKAAQEKIFEFFKQRMELVDEGRVLETEFNRLSFLPTEVDIFVRLHFDVPDIGVTPLALEMSYEGLTQELDPGHRGFALIGSNSRTGMDPNGSYISLFFTPGNEKQTLLLNDEPTSDIFLRFLEHGIWHIWLGFDHVLFLIALLLSSVMLLSGSAWQPSDNLNKSLLNTVKIVTIFTIAHTVTLTLATFNIITLPVVFVEAVIALSIAVVALGNLWPRFHTQAWIVVFIFGLFHGFGFANVLEPLGLDPARKALGLVAFNIGVEVGQIAIVLIVFPILYVIRTHTAYRKVAFQGGSVALIAIALFWFYERTADVFLPGSAAANGVLG